MFEYDNNAKLAVEILDKYDISEELLDGHGMEVGEVQDMLLNKFKDNKDLANAIVELSEDELCTYLSKKYDCKFCSNGTFILKSAVHLFLFSGMRFLLKSVRFSFIIVM